MSLSKARLAFVPVLAALPLVVLATPSSAAHLGAAAVSTSEVPQIVNLPAAVAGRPYFATVPAARSRVGGWRLDSGALPAGLGFASAGSVSGLPRSAGSSVFVLSRAVKGSTDPEIRLVRLQVVPAAAPVHTRAEVTATSGAISGTVTSASGPIAGACVEAQNAAGAAARASTTPTGTYAISGLAPGIWEVEFSGCGNQNYVSQWYNARLGPQGTQTTAGGVAVSAGKTSAGVWAKLVAGGQIVGAATAAESGKGLGSVCAEAFGSTGFPSPPVASAVTSPQGTYVIVGLPAGLYEVEFAPCSASLNRVATWYGSSDPTFATGVKVASGETVSGVSASLALGGEITGTVTSAATGKGVGGVCVQAYSEVETVVVSVGSPQAGTERPSLAGASGSNGAYTIAGLPAGDYTVQFGSCREVPNLNYVLPAVWGETKNPSLESPVVVKAGSTASGINIALQAGGEASGTVTAAGTKAPISSVCVLLEDQYGGSLGAITGAKGNYLAIGLAAGQYNAVFLPCAGQNYIPVAGSAVTVKARGVTTGVSAALAVGGSISGLVTAGSTPLTDLCVQGFPVGSSGGEFAYTPLTFAGSYVMNGLATGGYDIEFFAACFGGPTNYLPGAWDNGQPVKVVAGGKPVTGVNGKLATGGQITGTVTDAAGAPLSDVCAVAAPAEISPPGYVGGFTAYSVAGSFDILGLPTGEYNLYFQACDGQNYRTSEYDNGVTLKVTQGHTISGTSGVMQPGGEISGTVTDAKGRVLSGICVTVIGEFQANPIETGTVFGSYLLTGLIPNTEYEVEFSDCGNGGPYANQWWKDATTQAAATPVTVTVAQPATNIDAVMTG
jgi:hypothetical protein